MAHRNLDETYQLTTDEALELLVNLVREIFSDRIQLMRQTEIRRRFEKELFANLESIAKSPANYDIDEQPAWVQRLIYEMLTQYIMFYSLQPGIELNVAVNPKMSEHEKISLLLSQEIIVNSWPYPQSVPL